MRKRSSDGDVELAFLRVLKAIADTEQEAGLGNLDYADKAMLYHIALNERADDAIKITDLEKGGAFGTLPTVLARVTRLVDQGWIDKAMNPDDARSRIVSSTSQARKFFQKASKAVTSAIGG